MEFARSVSAQRRALSYFALASAVSAGLASVAKAQLSEDFFTGTGQTFNATSNWTPSLPKGTALGDVNAIPQTSGVNKVLGIYSTTPPTGDAYVIGAVEFDTGLITATDPIDFDASTVTTNTTPQSLALQGGNTVPTGNTSLNDLITITSQVKGVVYFRGLNGGGNSTGTAGLTVSVPLIGGNFDIATPATMEIGDDAYLATASGTPTAPLVLDGGGTLLLNNSDPNFTSGLVVDSSTLNVGNLGALGPSTGSTTTLNTAAFNFSGGTSTGAAAGHAFGLSAGASSFAVTNAGVALAIEGIISGSATSVLNNTGPGTLLLQGANTFGGGVNITAGVLGINDGTNLGPAPSSLATDITINGGTLLFNQSITTTPLSANRGIVLGPAGSAGSGEMDVAFGNTVIVASPIADNTGGAGSLVVASDTPGFAATGAAAGIGTAPGTLVLTSANSYSGTTSINSGTLQIDDGGSTATLGGGAVTIATGATLAFDRSDTSYTVANSIGGQGNLTQMGTGTTTLSAANTYSGDTTISAGTLEIAPTGNVASGNITVAASANLIVDSGGSVSPSVNFTVNGSYTENNSFREISTLNGSGSVFLAGTTLSIDNGGTFSGVISDDAPASLNVAGGTLTLSGVNTYTGVTDVRVGGDLIITGTGSLSGATNIYVPPPNILDSQPVRPYLLASANLEFQANPSTGFLPRPIASLNLNSNGFVTVDAPSASANRTVLVVSALNFAGSSAGWQGMLDLNANDMIVHNGNLANITSQIAEAINGGIAGIRTSAATATTTLGVELNADSNGNPLFSTFDGQSVSNTDVLVKYTYFGDANLDGVVNGSDYTLIDNGFNNQLTGWQNGDFNYDGVVNGDDYTLIDNGFNNQGASLAADPQAMIAADTAQIAAGSSATAVPEPALGLMLLSAATLMVRRRR